MKIFSFLVAGKIVIIDSTIEGFCSLFFARISPKKAGIVLLIFCFAFFEFLFPKLSFAFGSNLDSFHLSSPSVPLTASLFSEKTIYNSNILNFSKKTVVDPLLNPGEEKIITKGIPGKRLTQLKIVSHKGVEFSREETLVENTKAIDETVAVGPFPSTSFLDTPNGKLSYTIQLRLWATAYDSHCPGCGQTTSIGLQTGFGIVAVDPKVIPLRSKLYIPGYGTAIAGDTGGAVKGGKIDLGFADASQSGWFAHFVEVYVLN